MKSLKNILHPTRSGLLIIGVVGALLIGSYIVISRRPDQQAATVQQPSAEDTTDSQSANTGTMTAAVHDNIIATVFWVGEAASEDNDYIQNRSSAWQDDWMSHYGGEDNPDTRCGYNPCGFTPKENPFYYALPYNDYKENGQPKSASVLRKIPWYAGQPKADTSLLKNRWVEITGGNTKVYAQWEDVGPFGEDDVDYVFGSQRPQEKRAGIDLSPATADYLHVDGRGTVSWKFVDEAQVPAGPWKDIITTSGLAY